MAADLATDGTAPSLDPSQPLAVLLRLHAPIGGQPLILFLGAAGQKLQHLVGLIGYI